MNVSSHLGEAYFQRRDDGTTIYYPSLAEDGYVVDGRTERWLRWFNRLFSVPLTLGISLIASIIVQSFSQRRHAVIAMAAAMLLMVGLVAIRVVLHRRLEARGVRVDNTFSRQQLATIQQQRLFKNMSPYVFLIITVPLVLMLVALVIVVSHLT